MLAATRVWTASDFLAGHSLVTVVMVFMDPSERYRRSVTSHSSWISTRCTHRGR